MISILSGLGVHLDLPISKARIDRLLFAEGGSRIVVSISPDQIKGWQNFIDEEYDTKLSVQCLGKVTSDSNFLVTLAQKKLIDLPLAKLKEQYEEAIPVRMANNFQSNN